jgi:hypothetical protein
MPSNAFINRREEPADGDLTAELGGARPLWDEVLAALPADCKTREWHSYSIKAGWALRIKREKRTILYLSPCKGSFLASFALGDRAVEAARNCGLPQKVIKIINESKRYAEGTGVRIEVTTPKDIAIVRKLVEVKLAN